MKRFSMPIPRRTRIKVWRLNDLIPRQEMTYDQCNCTLRSDYCYRRIRNAQSLNVRLRNKRAETSETSTFGGLFTFTLPTV